MVAEKEGLSPHKERPPQLQEPLRQAKRTKKQVSDGFTIKAMMKNTVVRATPATRRSVHLVSLKSHWKGEGRAGITILCGHDVIAIAPKCPQKGLHPLWTDMCNESYL